MIKKSYTVKGMHCPSCALVIESDLEDAGITAQCNYARAILDVEFDETKVQEAKIADVVHSSGYSLD